MKTTAPKVYETPATEVVAVRTTGMICESTRTVDYEYGNLDES